MTANHERANASFHAEGHTSDAVLKQAVHISVPEDLRSPVTPVRLEGPADTGDAGIDPEHVVSLEGEAVASESEGEVAPNTTIPDPEHPAAAHLRCIYAPTSSPAEQLGKYTGSWKLFKNKSRLMQMPMPPVGW